MMDGARSDRWYEGRSAPFEGEPLRSRLAIIAVGDAGEGLQSLVDVRAGELVFRFDGEERTDQTLFTLQLAPGRFIEDTLVMGKVLHHCDPNCDVDMAGRTFTARRDIAAGDIITMDYEQTEDTLWRSFDCGCDAAECRGRIMGRVVHASA